MVIAEQKELLYASPNWEACAANAPIYIQVLLDHPPYFPT